MKKDTAPKIPLETAPLDYGESLGVVAKSVVAAAREMFKPLNEAIKTMAEVLFGEEQKEETK